MDHLLQIHANRNGYVIGWIAFVVSPDGALYGPLVVTACFAHIRCHERNLVACFQLMLETLIVCYFSILFSYYCCRESCFSLLPHPFLSFFLRPRKHWNCKKVSCFVTLVSPLLTQFEPHSYYPCLELHSFFLYFWIPEILVFELSGPLCASLCLFLSGCPDIGWGKCLGGHGWAFLRPVCFLGGRFRSENRLGLSCKQLCAMTQLNYSWLRELKLHQRFMVKHVLNLSMIPMTS